MARPLLIPDPQNATIEELKQLSRVASTETAARCTAIQMLLAGADRDLVCNALLVTNRALRKWISRFNHSGVDGLIVKKRPGRMAIFNGQQALELADLIDQPQQADRTFWTAKAFHGYISKSYQVECSYETVVRFFLKCLVRHPSPSYPTRPPLVPSLWIILPDPCRHSDKPYQRL